MKTSATVGKEFIFFLMLILLCATSYVLAKKYSHSWNIAASQSLSDTTCSLLKTINEPLTATLYSHDIETYYQAQYLLTKYQVVKPDIQLHWEKVPYQHSSDYQGPALALQMGEQQEVIDLLQATLQEQTLTQALFKLRQKINQWIVFLQGHDEPSPFGTRATDYRLLRTALQNQGYKIQTLSLIQTPLIADNTRMLIIASPKSKLLPQEERIIADYLFQGGSLLWLIDNEMHAQPFLSELFQVTPLPGTIVDLHGHRLGTPHPAITIIDTYSSTPFTAPKSLTAFPFAVALQLHSNSHWTTQALLFTNEQSWTETGALSGPIAFEPEKGEVVGPLVLGVSLTKSHPLHPQSVQRIVIIGNSRFLSDGVIENYGNLALGLNMIHWLGHDDALLTLSQPVNQDELIQLHYATALFIQYGFPLCALMLVILLGYRYFKRLNKDIGRI